MLTSVTDQVLQESLNGVPVNLRFKWNTRFSFWSVNISHRDGTPIINGIKLVRDTPLISYLKLADLDGELLLSRLNGDWDYPTFNSINAEMAVVWLDPADIEAITNGTF